MRRILHLVAILCLAATLAVTFASPPTPVARAADPAPALVLGVGDSLMAGVGASVPDDRGEFGLFLTLARGRFGPNVRGADVALPGETSGTLLVTPPPRSPAPPAPPGPGTPAATATATVTTATATAQIDGAQAELRRLPEGSGAIVLLSIGGNDLLALTSKNTNMREAALATFRTNLDTIFQRLTVDGRTRQLLVQTVYDPSGGDPAVSGSDANWVELFNGAIRDAAKPHPEAVVVELGQAVRGNEGTLTLARYGDIHLSNAGHRRAADLLWTASGADRTPPDATLLSPEAGSAPRPVLTIRATVTDDSGADGVARVLLLVDGKETGDLLPRPDLAPNMWLGIWDGRSISGPHVIGVRATDHAGNTRDTTVNITVGTSS